MELVAASDLPTVDYTSPFVVWLERLFKHVVKGGQPETSREIDIQGLDDSLITEWRQFSPDKLLWVPLKVAASEGEQVGSLLLFRQEGWSAAEQALMDHLGGTIGHALFAWRRHGTFKRLRKTLLQRKIMATTLAALGAAMWLPVSLSALAPVEVIPKDPVTIAAPINGAVKKVLVEPNQQISSGQPLVQFDDTELASELDVAAQALLVAEAELKTVRQSGFLDPKQKARVAELETRVRLRQAELEYARTRFNKSRMNAPEAGIAVLADPDQWQGRPVSIGERIMLLADPDRVELEIMLPVKDSIALERGAKAKIFFDSDPLNAYPARISHAEYKPTRTPEEVLAFRLVARLDAGDQVLPRIGSRGTAKVYGGDVTLFFYLFRRPVTSLRQWLGW